MGTRKEEKEQMAASANRSELEAKNHKKMQNQQMVLPFLGLQPETDFNNQNMLYHMSNQHSSKIQCLNLSVQ